MQNDPNVRLAQGQSPAFDPIVPVGPNSPPPLTPNGDIHQFPNQGPLPHIAPQLGAAGGVGYYNEPLADIIIDAEEAQTGRFMAGASVNSNLGVFGSFVIDERNFDIGRWPKSWEDIRNGTAWRGAGQRFGLKPPPVARSIVTWLVFKSRTFSVRHQPWTKRFVLTTVASKIGTSSVWAGAFRLGINGRIVIFRPHFPIVVNVSTFAPSLSSPRRSFRCLGKQLFARFSCSCYERYAR